MYLQCVAFNPASPPSLPRRRASTFSAKHVDGASKSDEGLSFTMDSLDDSRDGVIRRKSQGVASASRPSSRRASDASLHDEDPLSTSTPAAAPARPAPLPNALRMASTPQQSRIAVVLPKKSILLSSAAQSDGTEHLNDPIISDLTTRTNGRTNGRTLSALEQAAPPSTSGTALKPMSRGRPKGWKPGMSYAEMRGNERPARQAKSRPLPSGFTGWKRRGRQPRAPSPQPRDVYRGRDAPFVAYVCEWVGCKAELHNMDTLRRHIYAVHCPKNPFICRWGKCERRNDKHGPVRLADDCTFRAHVEQMHLVPMAWHLGDGPRNSVTVADTKAEDEMPEWLKDSQGNQVTPSIKEQELEDWATWKSNRKKLKELLIRMNDNLPSEDEDDVIDEDVN